MKMKCFVAVVLLAFTFIANAQNLFVNGSMTGPVGQDIVPTGWTNGAGPTPNTPDTFQATGAHPGAPDQNWTVQPHSSPDGGTWLNLFGRSTFSGGRESVYQTVTGLLIGETYQFSYYFARHRVSGTNGAVGYNGNVAPDITISGMAGYSNPAGPSSFENWDYHSVYLVATATSATFTLYGTIPTPNADPDSRFSYAAYDGLVLRHVPEPSGALLFVLGGSLAVLRRRR